MSVRIRVTGRVTDTVLRVTREGVPHLLLHLDDADSKQRVTVRIVWTDGSHASQFTAGAQRARYRNQAIAVEAINPKFKKARLECEASHLAGVQILQPTATP